MSVVKYRLIFTILPYCDHRQSWKSVESNTRSWMGQTCKFTEEHLLCSVWEWTRTTPMGKCYHSVGVTCKLCTFSSWVWSVFLQLFFWCRLRTTSRRTWRQRWLNCSRAPSTTTQQPCWKWAPTFYLRRLNRRASWLTLRRRWRL